MLVSLAILGLIFSLTLSVQGPWLGRTKQVERNAAFWNATGSARATLEEIAASTIDPGMATVSPNQARLLISNARLSPSPIWVAISVRENELLIASAEKPEIDTVLLKSAQPLRLTAEQSMRADGRASVVSALVVEIRRGETWSPLIRAGMGATGPLACNFDLISRRCR